MAKLAERLRYWIYLKIISLERDIGSSKDS
jgi:hypothetical protein